jgi:SPP1 family predicted phage head-tail adaptor
MIAPSGAGEYRTPFAVQAETQVADASGQLQPTWTTVANLHGLKRGLTGSEATNSLQTKAVVSFVVECRHPRSLVAVDPTMRLVIRGQNYGIEWTNDVDDRHETLLIYCTQQVTPAGS